MAGYRYLTGRQQRAVDDRLYGSDPTVGRYLDGGVIRDRQYEASGSNMSGPELYYRSRGMGGRLPLPKRVSGGPPAGAGILSLIKSLYGEEGSRRKFVQPFIDLASDASEAATSGLATLKRISESDPLRPGSRLSALLRGADDLGASAGEAIASNIRPIALTRPRSGEQLAGLDPAAVRMSGKAGPGFNAAVPAPVRSIQRGARPTPPISGGPVETDPEKIARVIASRPRRESPSEALSRGDVQAAIFREGGDPRSEQLAAEAAAYIGKTAGATLLGETPMRRLPSGRLVSVAPGLSDTRQVDTSGGGTVGDLPSVVPAIGRQRPVDTSGGGTVGDLPAPAPVAAVVPAEVVSTRSRPKPPLPVARPAPPEGPSTNEYPLGPNDAPVDPEISDSQYNEDPMGDASQSAVATKIATTSAKDLPNPNEKAIKKGFFENANMGMVEFGLRMASAASKPGATALGAAADAGVAMIDSKALRDAKKADTEFKQAMQKGLIDARASEGKKDRAERVARATAENNAAFRLQRERLNSTEGISVEELKLKNRQLTALEHYQLETIRVKSEGIESTSENSQRNLIQELVKTSGAIAKANNISVSGMTPDDAVAARLEMFTSTLQGVVGNSLIYNSLDKELVASYLPPAPTTAPAAGTGTDPTSVQSRLREAIEAKKNQ